MFSALEITGRARSHIIQHFEPRFAAHPEVADAFFAMRAAAKKDGFDLLPFSSFRDFATQVRIWNYKYIGRKPLYDIHGQVRNRDNMSEEEIIWHILDWSALPAASRHHWGTEIDVVDGAAMPEHYQPKLLPEEVAQGGIFHPLHQWLDEHIQEFGFFRPYRQFQGGMFPEPWHLSYQPIASQAIQDLKMEILVDVIAQSEIAGKDLVLKLLPDIYQKHILNICAV